MFIFIPVRKVARPPSSRLKPHSSGCKRRYLRAPVANTCSHLATTPTSPLPRTLFRKPSASRFGLHSRPLSHEKKNLPYPRSDPKKPQSRIGLLATTKTLILLLFATYYYFSPPSPTNYITHYTIT